MIFLPTFEINLSCQISLCLWRKNSDGSQDTKERTWVKCCSKVKCSMRQSSMLHPACKVFSRSPGTVQFRLRVLLCVFFFETLVTLSSLKFWKHFTGLPWLRDSWTVGISVELCKSAWPLKKRQPTPVHHVPAGINAAVAVAHRPSALKGQAVQITQFTKRDAFCLMILCTHMPLGRSIGLPAFRYWDSLSANRFWMQAAIEAGETVLHCMQNTHKSY